MDLERELKENYSIERIVGTSKTAFGSGNTYYVQTESRKYVAKLNERLDFILLYDRVQHVLNQEGIRQSRLIRTVGGCPATCGGIALYECLDGTTHRSLTGAQAGHALRFTKAYNEALAKVPFVKEDLGTLNHWDLAGSVDFITDTFPGILAAMNLDARHKRDILRAIDAIRAFSKEPPPRPRLIHADLGPDNFLFVGDQVISIIDFTPGYDSEIYSICQFIYWHYLWITKQVSRQEVIGLIAQYDRDYNGMDALYCSLLRTALFRIIGPLLEMVGEGYGEFSKLEARFLILSRLLVALGTDG